MAATTELSARLRDAGDHLTHGYDRLLREAAARLEHLEPLVIVLEADCAALREAFTAAGGAGSPTVQALVAAIKRGLVKPEG